MMFNVSKANVADPYLISDPLSCFSVECREHAARNVLANDCAFTFWYNEEIVGVMGLAWVHDKEMAAWAYLGEGIKKCKKSFAKAMKEGIHFVMKDKDLNRISVLVDVDNLVAIRQNEWMGLQQEGISRKSGLTGKDQVVLAMVRE